MRVAVIGQSNFASEVYKRLISDGHEVVAVFTIPDQGPKQDPLGEYLLHCVFLAVLKLLPCD